MRQKKSTLGEHIALLSVKHNIYPSEIFQALIKAKDNEKAVCGNLTVEYRGKVKDEVIFLIKKENNAVAQFRVDEQFLLRKDNPFESWMSTDKICKKIAKQNVESVFTSIHDLRACMKKVNVKAEVLEIPKPVQVHTQFGNTVRVVNALVGDETGKIKLCLWEGQINSVAVGDNIEIKNSHICVFRGEKAVAPWKKRSHQHTATPCSSNKQHLAPATIRQTPLILFLFRRTIFIRELSIYWKKIKR